MKQLEKGIAHRYLRLYDRELIDVENEDARKEKRFDLEMKRLLEQEGFNDPALLERFTGMMNTLKAIQGKKGSEKGEDSESTS